MGSLLVRTVIENLECFVPARVVPAFDLHTALWLPAAKSQSDCAFPQLVVRVFIRDGSI